MTAITCIMPGLCSIFSAADWQLLSKSWQKSPFALDYPQLIASLWPVEQFSLAHYAAHYCQIANENHWLKLTPISLNCDQAVCIVQHSKTHRLDAFEAQQLAQDLNQLYQTDGLKFHAGDGEILLETAVELGITTTPLYQVINHNLASHLPQGKNKNYWYKFLTELQMLLHQHPLNALRADSSRVLLNGLWLWGETKSTLLNSPFIGQTLYSDNTWLKHVAKFFSAEFHCLNPDFLQIPKLKLEQQNFFVVETFLYEQTHQSQIYAKQWLDLLITISAKPSHKIMLYPGDGYCYHLQHTQTFWQRLAKFFSS